jgi:hypothetical protein
MTYDEWYDNPSGKGTAVMTSRQMYKDMYARKFNLVSLRETAKFTCTPYKSGDEYTYYLHIKVPSEVIKDFYYDVVIEFFTKDSSISVSPTLRKYDIRVFSNDPAFVFTHVHAYSKANMIIKDLEAKLPKESLKRVAVEKNPKDDIWYVKSLIFAYYIIRQKDLFNKIHYKTAHIFKKKELLSKIMHASDKINLRQEAEKKLKEEERRKKRLELRKETERRNVEKTTAKVNGVVNTKRARNSKTSNIVQHTKTSKKI